MAWTWLFCAAKSRLIQSMPSSKKVVSNRAAPKSAVEHGGFSRVDQHYNIRIQNSMISIASPLWPCKQNFAKGYTHYWYLAFGVSVFCCLLFSCHYLSIFSFHVFFLLIFGNVIRTPHLAFVWRQFWAWNCFSNMICFSKRISVLGGKKWIEYLVLYNHIDKSLCRYKSIDRFHQEIRVWLKTLAFIFERNNFKFEKKSFIITHEMNMRFYRSGTYFTAEFRLKPQCSLHIELIDPFEFRLESAVVTHTHDHNM